MNHWKLSRCEFGQYEAVAVCLGDSLARVMLRVKVCKSRRVTTAVWWRVWDMSGVEDIDDAHGHAASGTHHPVGR